MFQTLQAPPPDTILSILDLFRADPRTEKLDLGVGVYKDQTGLTPILPSVRTAEARHVAQAQTKTYVGPAGDPRFVELVRDLAFGPEAPRERIGGVQTTGASLQDSSPITRPRRWSMCPTRAGSTIWRSWKMLG